MTASNTRLTDFDLHLIGEGSHYRTFEKLGAHLTTQNNIPGVHFAVWAPNAESVFVMGDFNNWNNTSSPLTSKGTSGIWEGFVENASKGQCYKYSIRSRVSARTVEKIDPFAFYAENPPNTASRIWDIEQYKWNDSEWLAKRKSRNHLDQPMLTYEMHLGSWRRNKDGGWLSYRELADLLPAYIKEMAFTHVEFMPITEHPFDGSWGYQTTGYFAPTSRFGTPDDFKFLIDTLHQNNIGVILDWVPAHFPVDDFALGNFDGTHLYEHADSRQGFHQEWGTYIFNFGRNEVSNFLIASALFWLEKYHIDGLRIDAVASMIYLDYARKPGEWVPNQYGGRENLDAINFIRRLNEAVYGYFPDTFTIAEESTSWAMVSRPVYSGGLGFGFKWNMGWMNDTLKYIEHEPIHRAYHHGKLTFSLVYAFHENFMLPLSHDEVVHCKSSLLGKMPGDDWQKFANLRLLYGYMYGHPGKKLLFMGADIAQWREWDFANSLDWHLLQFEPHRGVQSWLRDLNKFICSHPPLYEVDFEAEGFEWVDCNDGSQSILTFLRFAKDRSDCVLVALNFTPVARYNYRVGVPISGTWVEALNGDALNYGGSGVGNLGQVVTEEIDFHEKPYSMRITLPPLSAVFFKPKK